MWKIEVKPQAEKALTRIPNPHRRRIARAIDALAGDPRPSGCQKLTGCDDSYRIRVGDYRVVYQIFDKVLVIHIIRIGHRKEIYRNLWSPLLGGLVALAGLEDSTADDTGDNNGRGIWMGEIADYPHVQGFFESDIDRNVVPDLLKLQRLRPECGASCAIPEAMMDFAVLDWAGFLIRDCAANNHEIKDFYTNISYSISSKAALFPAEAEYVNNTHILINLFRNGMMHQVFPKRAGLRKNGISKLISYDDKNNPILNVDRLTCDTLKALSKIRTRTELYAQMDAKIQFAHSVSEGVWQSCVWDPQRYLDGWVR
jgi:mRNA interferase RelE/StbE